MPQPPKAKPQPKPKPTQSKARPSDSRWSRSSGGLYTWADSGQGAGWSGSSRSSWRGSGSEDNWADSGRDSYRGQSEQRRPWRDRREDDHNWEPPPTADSGQGSSRAGRDPPPPPSRPRRRPIPARTEALMIMHHKHQYMCNQMTKMNMKSIQGDRKLRSGGLVVLTFQLYHVSTTHPHV